METKKEPAADNTDHVLQALSTLAALLDRTINEVKYLDADFQSRLAQATQEKGSFRRGRPASRNRVDRHHFKTRRSIRKKRIAELSSEWQEERNRLTAELSKSSQATVQWGAERARLSGELERMSRVQAATQAEAEKAIMAMKASSTAAKNAKGLAAVNSEAVNGEIGRVEGIIKQISAD